MTDAWKSTGMAALWLPSLAAAEIRYHIPKDLLARMAFEESSFRAGVINGAIPSEDGALGIMQMLPQYFASVRAPKPFALAVTQAQILEAANFVASLYKRFGDWTEVVAAYNWGAGNEHHSFIEHGSYRLADMPIQTQNYVRQIFADVPIQGALLT